MGSYDDRVGELYEQIDDLKAVNADLLAALKESHCWSCRRRFTDPPAPNCKSCIQQRDAIDKAERD